MTTPFTAEGAAAAASEYDKLLGDMEAFAKAMATDDAGEAGDEGGDDKIEEAAEASGASDGNGEGAAAEGGEQEEPFGKSFTITLADGTEQEAFDGSAMLKSLMLQNDGLRTRLAASEGVISKQSEINAQLVTNLTGLGTMVKSLQSDIRKIGATGTGRRSAVNVHEKPSLTVPARVEGVKRGEVMAKAMSLMSEGKITGTDVARLESHVMGHGMPIPADLAPHFAG